MPEFTCDWFSQNIPALTEVLAKCKGRSDLRILEIGCFEGRGTLWFLDQFPGSTLTCIDTFKGSQEHEHFKMEFGDTYNKFTSNTRESTNIHLMVGKSLDQLIKLHQLTYTLWYDIVYVDGSHMACDVITDLVLSWPLLKKGGVMFMDDYEWPGTDNFEQHMPKMAIDFFTTAFIEQLKFLHKGYSVAVEKL